MSLTLNGSSGDGSSFAAAVNAGHDAAAFNQTAFDAYFTAKDTDDLSEGSTNLYHTTVNLTGEVTSVGISTTIADNIVDEANLKINNTAVDGKVLAALASASGGLTWADASAGTGTVTGVTAGAGMTQSGTSTINPTLNVIGTTNRISVASDAINIHTSYVGQTSITTLGTIGTGVWGGTTVAANKGGTGLESISTLLNSNTTASDLSDFDTEVANNTDVAANTLKTGITPGQASAITANTAKTTNATHTGEVTGDTTLLIADDVVDEANLKVGGTLIDAYVLTADTGATGGMKWAEAQGGTTAYYVQNFNGNGSTVAFTLSQTPADENNTQVYISGVYQQKDTYAVSGTTLTFSEAPSTGTDNIEVVIAPTAAIGTTSTDLVTFSPTGTGATDRTTQAKLRDVISVKDFGAVGDGSNDDTAEIQAAIDAVISFGGGKLFFPEGTYKITDVLTIDTQGWTDAVHFVGSGKVQSTIKQITTGKGVLEIGGRQHSLRDIRLQGVDGDSSAVVLAFGEHTIAVTSITHTGGVATVTTSVAHGYSSATNITIEGSTDTEFNGLFEITVTSTTAFTYVVTSIETSAAGTIKAISANGNHCSNNTVSNVTIKYGAIGISMKHCWGIYVDATHITVPSKACIKIKWAQFNIFENISMDGVGNDLGGLEEASIWYVYDPDGTQNTNIFRHINHNGLKAPMIKFDGVSPTNEIFEEFYDDNAAGFIAYDTTADLLNSQRCTFKNIYSNTRLPAYLKTLVDPFYWKGLNLQTHSGDKVNLHTKDLITNDHTTIGNLAVNGDYSRMTSSTRVDDWIHWNSAGSGTARELDVAAGAAYDGHAATGSPQSIHLTSSLDGDPAATYSTFDQRGSLTDAVSTSTNNVLDVKQTYLISAKVKVMNSYVGEATKLRAVRAYYDYTAYSTKSTHPDVSFTSGWQTLTCLTSGLPANTGTVAGLYLVHDGGASQILIADFKIVEAKPGNIKTAIIHVPATAASDVFELPVFSPNIPVVIMETFIIPSSDITGANTNYMTLEFRSKGTDGTGDTLMSDTAYTSGTDAADWVKYLVGHITVGGGATIGGIIKNGKTDLTTDEVVTIKKSATGTGMVTPAMTVGVTYFIP